MNLNIKPYLFIAGIIILSFAIIAVWRNAIPSKSAAEWDRQYGLLLKPIIFGLFFLFGLALVPLCLKLFVTLHDTAGNDHSPRLQWISSNAKQITFTVWAVFIIGLFAALPYLIKEGFFRSEISTQKSTN